MNKKILFLLSILLLTISACKKIPVVTLYISETHKEIFPDIKTNEINEDKIDSTINSIIKRGDSICSALYKKDRDIDTKLFKDMPKEKRNKLIEKWKNLKNSTLLGCRNWYELTDFGIISSSKKAATLIKKNSLNAYSVGFIQPYILFWKTNSKNLNFVDIDYRIINAHIKLISHLKTQKNLNAEEIINSLPLPYASSKVKSFYETDDNQINKNFNSKITYNELCPKKYRKDFEEALKWFQKNYKTFEKINFILSPLHEIDFSKTSEKGIPSIVFMSNAINPDFTSADEYRSFITNFSKSINSSNPAYTIYAFPGTDKYGIYKITGKKDLSTSPICSDHFIYKGFSKTIHVRCVGPRTITKPDIEIFTYADKDSGIKTPEDKEKILCNFK